MKRISHKLALIVVTSILLTLMLALGGMYAGNQVQLDKVLRTETEAALVNLSGEVTQMLADAQTAAQTLSRTSGLASAVQSKNAATIEKLVADTAMWIDAPYLSITDANGDVIYGAGQKTYIGGMHHVQSALSGSAGSYIGSTDSQALCLSAGAPIVNGQGLVIGAVSIGYDLADTAIVDRLQARTGVDFSIFHDNTRLNTTIAKDGVRQTGTVLDSRIATRVLTHGETYTGKATILGMPYYTTYAPLKDTAGTTIGVLFAGKSLSAIEALSTQVVLVVLVTVVLISIFIVWIAQRLAHRTVTRPIALMSVLSRQLAEGNLHGEPIDCCDTKDEIGALSQSLRQTVQTLQTYIDDITRILSQVSQGDLTATSTHAYIGDFAPIQQSLLTILASLNETLSTIQVVSQQVHAGAEQVSSTAQILSQGATEQAGSIQELSASIGDISHGVQQSATNVKEATEHFDLTVEDVSQSNVRMHKMLESMGQISHASEEISKIIKVIDDIAFQTNLLALNAAIEAARAGNAGKGFAVVADEVRNLAGKSAEAARQTTQLIENSLQAVSGGMHIARDTAESLESVRNRALLVQNLMQAIDTAAAEQARAIEQVTIGVDQISNVVQHNAATAQQSAAASQELSGQAALLSAEVARFQLARGIVRRK